MSHGAPYGIGWRSSTRLSERSGPISAPPLRPKAPTTLFANRRCMRHPMFPTQGLCIGVLQVHPGKEPPRNLERSHRRPPFTDRPDTRLPGRQSQTFSLDQTVRQSLLGRATQVVVGQVETAGKTPSRAFPALSRPPGSPQRAPESGFRRSNLSSQVPGC
jgi:hypothetical protein